MSSPATSPRPSPDKRSVRRMLTFFAILAIAGVLMLAISVAIGLVLLVVAEVFFAVAYRRFSRRTPSAP
jgi:4-hydroxybenzoate polyprenyltransferase